MSNVLPLYNCRIIIRDGEPWFALPDLLKQFGIPSNAEVGSHLWSNGVEKVFAPPGQPPEELTIISAANMYRLALRLDFPKTRIMQESIFADLAEEARGRFATMIATNDPNIKPYRR